MTLFSVLSRVFISFLTNNKFMKTNMKHIFLFIFVLASTLVINAASSPRTTLVLDAGWNFFLGDVPNGQSPTLNTKHWEQINIPHDWAIDKPFDMNIDKQMVRVIEDGDTIPQLRTGRTGALPMFGVGWYRKTLSLPETDAHKQVSVEFDGAMSNAQVWLNGQFVGKWPYGYTSFMFDLTPYFLFGKENVLAVRLDNKEESSRWYTGAGLYRPVRLVVKEPINIAHWGTFITTPEITAKKAVVNIVTKVENTVSTGKNIQLITEIYSPEGTKVGTATTKQIVTKGETAFEQKLTVKQALLWDVENPNLYKAVSKLYDGKTCLDAYETTFGIRSIRFDKDKGFFLNGKSMKMKGVCLHHDLGALGAAVNFRATERQLEMLKEMGCNAIRTSHNPPSQELLDLCDRMGFLVQVEAFDEWEEGKSKNGYHNHFDEWCERDLKAMIRRDRNHPCVIMWSIGNEIREQRIPDGSRVARRLAEICRAEDPTRPVTAGLDYHRNAIANKLAHELDLVGFNYKPHDYRPLHEQHPELTIYGSETSSTVSSRGVYKFPAKEDGTAWHADYHTSSYDTDRVPWGSLPDTEFVEQDDNEFIFGEFVWTGFDYLGEPTPYNEGTPARSSYFGIIDLAGLKKDRFYLYQSHWSDKPVLHVLPHWNFPEREGKNVPVFCYTNYPKAELFVNGKSMGVRTHDHSDKLKRYRLMWEDIVYEQGEIKVVAYNTDGNPAEEKIIKTAGRPHRIKMTADRTTITAGGKDLSFITVEVLDKDGNPCPTAVNYLFFEAEGAGKIKALCNGDPTDHTSFASHNMHLFSGKLVVVLESGNESGSITLKSYGGGLASAEIGVKVE